VIECDGKDKASSEIAIDDYSKLEPDELLLRMLDGGIVGLGGAVFPTAQKLMQARTCKIDYLILNGVECEPYISCDDVLMRECATEVLSGAQILMHALQVNVCLIAVESDKPEAILRLGQALADLGDQRIVLKQLPSVYPSGGEDQLVQLVTDREVPSRGLPTDVGCVVQNVGTAAAVHDWIVNNQPLISRITTVTGDGVDAPANMRARIGTPVADVISFAGGYTDQARHLIIGGPMTGKSVTTDEIPLVKASNCVLVVSDAPSPGDELPCIRCGDCASVCPVRLLPQQLLWYARADDEKKLRDFCLTDCIECGCCDLVCPSHIPLTANFRKAKIRIQEVADEKARADRAKRRFEARTRRLEREHQERAAELARQKSSAKAAGPAAIAEILKRRQKKDEFE
jgi:electron transport complex protein RnfC